MRIVEQALRELPDGPVRIDDPRFVLPREGRRLQHHRGHDAALQAHHGGRQGSRRRGLSGVEGGNGELGFYIVSDGSGRPYRVRVRPPCFLGMAALGADDQGHMIADIVPTFGMMNMIGGECDR